MSDIRVILKRMKALATSNFLEIFKIKLNYNTTLKKTKWEQFRTILPKSFKNFKRKYYKFGTVFKYIKIKVRFLSKMEWKQRKLKTIHLKRDKYWTKKRKSMTFHFNSSINSRESCKISVKLKCLKLMNISHVNLIELRF